MNERYIPWREKRNRDKLQDQLDLGLSYDQIGRIWGTSRQNIHATIERYGLQRHPIPFPDKPHICETCGKERFKTYCPECRQRIEVDETKVKEEEMKKRNEEVYEEMAEEIIFILCDNCLERFIRGDALLEESKQYHMPSEPPIINDIYNFLKKCRPCFNAFYFLIVDVEEGLI